MQVQRDGFVFEQRPDGWSVVAYKGDGTHVVVPDQVDGSPVVLIAARAFEGNRNMAQVEVPASVTFIGNYAFASCPALVRACVHACIESLNLGTFWNCTALADVQLPDGLAHINDGAFRGCASLRTLEVPASVTFVGDSAFRECSSLESIVLDGAIETIERSAFRECPKLAHVAISTSLAYLGTRAFQDCPSLASVTLLGQDVDTTLTAFLNHGFTYLVADYAVDRGVISFEEALKRLNGKIEADRLFAARVLAAQPERLGEVFGKQLLARTLAGGGCTHELRVLAEVDGFLSPASLPACIDAASAAGHTETAAFLLDLLGEAGPAQPASSSLRL